MLNAHRAIPTKAKHHGIDGKPKSGSIKNGGMPATTKLDNLGNNNRLLILNQSTRIRWTK
jgi:hypothetical protein